MKWVSEMFWLQRYVTESVYVAYASTLLLIFYLVWSTKLNQKLYMVMDWLTMRKGRDNVYSLPKYLQTWKTKRRWKVRNFFFFFFFFAHHNFTNFIYIPRAILGVFCSLRVYFAYPTLREKSTYPSPKIYHTKLHSSTALAQINASFFWSMAKGLLVVEICSF